MSSIYTYFRWHHWGTTASPHWGFSIHCRACICVLKQWEKLLWMPGDPKTTWTSNKMECLIRLYLQLAYIFKNSPLFIYLFFFLRIPVHKFNSENSNPFRLLHEVSAINKTQLFPMAHHYLGLTVKSLPCVALHCLQSSFRYIIPLSPHNQPWNRSSCPHSIGKESSESSNPWLIVIGSRCPRVRTLPESLYQVIWISASVHPGFRKFR